MKVFFVLKVMILTMLLMSIHLPSSAQVTPGIDSIQTDQMIDPIIEIAPTFPGGHEKLKRFVKKHQKMKGIPKGISGKVFLEFVVEKTGELSEVRIIRGLCDECDLEAIRLVKAMPKWTPGNQGGNFVRTRMVLPFVFNR